MNGEYTLAEYRERERCSICGSWMTSFDTSFEWEGETIPNNLYMCTNPRCPDHVDKNFLPKSSPSEEWLEKNHLSDRWIKAKYRCMALMGCKVYGSTRHAGRCKCIPCEHLEVTHPDGEKSYFRRKGEE